MSVFLDRPARDHVARNALAFAIRDGFPVSPGHTLVIPFREVATWFDASREEQLAILDLIDEVKAQLDAEFAPSGYNVGFNAGAAAGQTVMHLHVHVIPRYEGDVADPRGGVRHVMPGKGNYLADAFEPAAEPTPRASALTTGGKSDALLRALGPELRGASALDVVAAFVQQSGLAALEAALAAMAPGASLRILTGDYLGITQADALRTLLDWQSGVSPVASRASIDADLASVAVRVVETAKLPTSSRSFHPKAWMVGHQGGRAVAWVGSSNLSRAALTDGVEWNLRLDRAADLPAWLRLREAFDALWQSARPLDKPFVDVYRQRVRVHFAAQETATAQGKHAAEDDRTGDIEDEGGSLTMPTPHEVQSEALAALDAARAAERGRALAVMATGLGKTWLAAFDVAKAAARLGRTPRLLFLAHRVELLVQAARTFRVMAQSERIEATIGMFVGAEDALHADFVFASVQKLDRPQARARLARERWDYVVVDEVHHATADSYRRVVNELDAGFVLGLTATPDRADGASVQGLFDDHVAIRADLARGIQLGLLVPIAYHGLSDPVDYQPIPWRRGQFDAEELARAVATNQRMEKVWQAWQEHPGEQTLVFCCSIAHADFVCGWLRERGVDCAALHSGPESHDRDLALDAFANGTLAALITVDLLNEGVDVPSVDRVVFLRPSDSPVVFLQQLGRGLRRAEGKSAVTVLDLVGNHAVFLRRMRALLDALPASDESPATIAGWLTAARMAGGDVAMPAGCTMTLELEAIDLLRDLASVGKDSPGAQRFRELWLSTSQRPTAAEMYRLGFNPRVIGGKGRGFLAFAADEGALDVAERAALAGGGGAFLRELERTSMVKCFKMVALQAMVEADALHGDDDRVAGLPLTELARRSLRLLARSPELRRDLYGVKELGAPADAAAVEALDLDRFAGYWRKNPVAAWIGESGKKVRPQFRLETWGDVEWLVPRFEVNEVGRAAFEALVVELVEWRLAAYRGARKVVAGAGGEMTLVCKVLRNDRHPILKLPDRAKNPGMPEGEVEVTLPDGARWVFRFAKEFVNVAYPVGETSNRLGELLVGWFGQDAGRPGTVLSIRILNQTGRWVLSPAAD